MNKAIPRERIERFGRMMAEMRRREDREMQSQRGYIDEDGVLQCGLMAFIRRFWHILEPEAPLVEGWALYAIVLHLEAVHFGEIKRLLMTVPPGFMKSLCSDVFFPAWVWGPMGCAHLRFVAFSYSSSLTERDNERFRDLITHHEFQAMWGKECRPVKVGATKVSNTKKGWKLASSVGGVGTGERSDFLLVDDAHNIKEAESEVIRTETVRWFRESLSDRLNNLQTGAIVVIMQRSHEDDVAGAILSMGLPYCHLMIPMEYDWSRQVGDDGPVETEIGWSDPRYDPAGPEECDHVLAWPERFPPKEVKEIKDVKGPYAYAGQYQQSPSPRGGGIFKMDYWRLYEGVDGKFPAFDYILASLDSAFTEKEENDPSALTVWGVFQDPEQQPAVMLIHAWRKRLVFHGPEYARNPGESDLTFKRRTMKTWGLIEWTADTCTRFNVDLLLIEGKASGISAAQELRRLYKREKWGIQLAQVKGDKVARALAAVPTFAKGMVWAPDRPWAQDVIDEMAVFPKGRYKDLTDSATQAIKYLRDNNLIVTSDEVRAAREDAVRQKKQPRALYPC